MCDVKMKEIKLVGEHWRDNVLGLRYDKRLELAMLKRHSDDLAVLRAERLLKGEVDAKRGISEAVIVANLNPRNQKINDVGFNESNDLILDNFGTWLAGVVRAPASSTLTTVSLTDTGNAARTVHIYGEDSAAQVFNHASSAAPLIGTKLQVGSDDTAAERDDYTVGTAFAGAPESGTFSTNNGSYAVGAISFSGAITAGDSITVKETGFFGSWIYYSNSLGAFMLFHDILDSGVEYAAGETVNVAYNIDL